MRYETDVSTGITTEHEDAPGNPDIVKTKAQLKVEELLALGTKYKEDMLVLQMNWLTVSVADGTTEVDKKTLIQGDIADLKAKYVADKVIINQKYL